MRLVNLSVNPNALKRVTTWSPAGESVSVRQNDDGSWTYTGAYGGSVVVPFDSSNALWTPGEEYVFVMHCDPVSTLKWVGPETVVRDGSADGVWHVRYKPADGQASAPFWHPQFSCPDAVTIRRLGIYTQSDFDQLQSLGLDWFDGDLMPRE